MAQQSEYDKQLSRAAVAAHRAGDYAAAWRYTKMLRKERKINPLILSKQERATRRAG